MTIKHFAAIILMISGCSDGPQGFLSAAEGALGKGDHAGAITAADRGLAAKPADAKLRWRLELVRLEALARSGQAGETEKTIERLASEKDTQIKASHYLSTADQLRTGGEKAGAIQLLDKGKKRFPDDAAIAKAITQAKEKGSDEELDTLRSLGYLD
jgi:predicted Zn-dependent protease